MFSVALVQSQHAENAHVKLCEQRPGVCVGDSSGGQRGGRGGGSVSLTGKNGGQCLLGNP